MTLKDLIKKIQAAMNNAGSKLTIDGDYGASTAAESEKYDILVSAKLKAVAPSTTPSGQVENPSFKEANKYLGEGEKKPGFVAFLSKYWPKTGLNYKTIIGSSFAWCALFVVAMQSDTGQKYIASAAAKSHAKTGIEIDWKNDGIPRGAIVHLDHDCDCKGDSNHVGFSNGRCSASDLQKPGATVAILGGNQSNAVNIKAFKVCEICAVRWPAEVEKPGPVVQSENCSTTEPAGSTR